MIRLRRRRRKDPVTTEVVVDGERVFARGEWEGVAAALNGEEVDG